MTAAHARTGPCPDDTVLVTLRLDRALRDAIRAAAKAAGETSHDTFVRRLESSLAVDAAVKNKPIPEPRLVTWQIEPGALVLVGEGVPLVRIPRRPGLWALARLFEALARTE